MDHKPSYNTKFLTNQILNPNSEEAKEINDLES